MKVNWLQDIGPIYSADDYIPHASLPSNLYFTNILRVIYYKNKTFIQ
jgi:hypothetical protein